MRKSLKPLMFVVLLFLLIGTIGFHLTSGTSLVDSLWYTSMTLTTVGYGVPDNFTDSGKIFTIFLMLFGVSIVLYSMGELVLEMMSGKILKEYKLKKYNKTISNLKDHVIVCGLGRNGRQAVRKLNLHNKVVVLIDLDEIDPSIYGSFNKVHILKGDATDESVLINAGIKTASGILTALPSDADNLFVVMSSKQLNPSIKIISRASKDNSVEKLKTAGANNVIMPNKLGGEHMASLLVAPDLIEFIDQISIEGAKNVNMAELATAKSKNKSAKILGDLDIKGLSGCLLIGYKTTSCRYIINPSDEQEIEEGSFIIVLGSASQIEKAKTLFLT